MPIGITSIIVNCDGLNLNDKMRDLADSIKQKVEEKFIALNPQYCDVDFDITEDENLKETELLLTIEITDPSPDIELWDFLKNEVGKHLSNIIEKEVLPEFELTDCSVEVEVDIEEPETEEYDEDGEEIE